MDTLRNDICILKRKDGVDISLNGVPLHGVLSYSISSDSENLQIATLNLSIGVFGHLDIKSE